MPLLWLMAGTAEAWYGADVDGLNLRRAWCSRSIAGALPPGDVRRSVMLDAAKTHLDAGLAHLTADYVGEHRLASFAVLALDAERPNAGVS